MKQKKWRKLLWYGWNVDPDEIWHNLPSDHSLEALSNYVLKIAPELSRECVVYYLYSLGLTPDGKTNIDHQGHMFTGPRKVFVSQIKSCQNGREYHYVCKNEMNKLLNNFITLDTFGFVINLDESFVAQNNKISIRLFDQIVENNANKNEYKYCECDYCVVNETIKNEHVKLLNLKYPIKSNNEMICVKHHEAEQETDLIFSTLLKEEIAPEPFKQLKNFSKIVEAADAGVKLIVAFTRPGDEQDAKQEEKEDENNKKYNLVTFNASGSAVGTHLVIVSAHTVVVCYMLIFLARLFVSCLSCNTCIVLQSFFLYVLVKLCFDVCLS